MINVALQAWLFTWIALQFQRIYRISRASHMFLNSLKIVVFTGSHIIIILALDSMWCLVNSEQNPSWQKAGSWMLWSLFFQPEVGKMHHLSESTTWFVKALFLWLDRHFNTAHQIVCEVSSWEFPINANPKHIKLQRDDLQQPCHGYPVFSLNSKYKWESSSEEDTR